MRSAVYCQLPIGMTIELSFRPNRSKYSNPILIRKGLFLKEYPYIRFYMGDEIRLLLFSGEGIYFRVYSYKDIFLINKENADVRHVQEGLLRKNRLCKDIEPHQQKRSLYSIILISEQFNAYEKTHCDFNWQVNSKKQDNQWFASIEPNSLKKRHCLNYTIFVSSLSIEIITGEIKALPNDTSE